MDTNKRPYNRKIYTIVGLAEIFWQAMNLQHIAENYINELSKKNKQHDLLFNDIAAMLSQDPFFEPIKGRKMEYEVINYHPKNKQYYRIITALDYRNDNELYILPITCYKCNDAKLIKKYHEDKIKRASIAKSKKA